MNWLRIASSNGCLFEKADSLYSDSQWVLLQTGAAVDVWQRIGITVACITLPVVWGVVVNWLFDLWSSRKASTEDDSIFPDYQI